MQARKSIVMQWNYSLLVVHYSVLIMLNARLWDFSFLGWMLPNLLLAFICTKYDHYLCIQNPLNQFLPHESTVPTYMRYSFAVLSKFVCAIPKFQNKFLFCVLIPLMKRQGVADIFPCKICYSQDECLFTCHCTRVRQRY